jgi:hypothetical protein
VYSIDEGGDALQVAAAAVAESAASEYAQPASVVAEVLPDHGRRCAKRPLHDGAVSDSHKRLCGAAGGPARAPDAVSFAETALSTAAGGGDAARAPAALMSLLRGEPEFSAEGAISAGLKSRSRPLCLVAEAGSDATWQLVVQSSQAERRVAAVPAACVPAAMASRCVHTCVGAVGSVSADAVAPGEADGGARTPVQEEAGTRGPGVLVKLASMPACVDAPLLLLTYTCNKPGAAHSQISDFCTAWVSFGLLDGCR